MSKPVNIQQRVYDKRLLSDDSDLHPILKRIYSSRGVESFDQTNYELTKMLAPQKITNLEPAAELLADHVLKVSNILIFGDFDADGATSTALCIKALNLLGHQKVDFLLPDRFTDGYGVSISVAEKIINLKPDLLITVDTGISSFNGIQLLVDSGIEVIVTDHHLPADLLPNASEIVNPNAFQESEGKCLAGVGVAFYLMLMLRQQLRKSEWFANEQNQQEKLSECLDLVAIGTVADLVPLDFNNRLLINEGIKRIRAGVTSNGIKQIIQQSGRSQKNLSSQDIGFSLAPRINAAGRMDDMSLGVKALLATNDTVAFQLASELEKMNHNRKQLQDEMTQQAMTMLPDVNQISTQYSVVLHQPNWHEGLVGIIASKTKEVIFRPTICFALSESGELKGSGRSITGVHLRDMLDLVDKQNPGLIIRFGGHAMAAGLTINVQGLEQFSQQFEAVLQQNTDSECFDELTLCDGQIETDQLTLDLAKLIRNAGPWGQKFPVPSFQGEFQVLDQRVLSGKHLKFVLTATDKHQPTDAIMFFCDDEQLKTNYQTINLHYEVTVNEFRNQQNLQLLIRHIL